MSNFYNCDGKYFFEKDRSVKCHKHKSRVNLSDAIKYSCNPFFVKILKSTLINLIVQKKLTKIGFLMYLALVLVIG